MSAAVIILRRKKFIRRFAEQGATCPDRAIPFEDVDMRRSWIFDQMVSRGVFVRAGNDRFYMNQEAASAHFSPTSAERGADVIERFTHAR